MDNRIVQTATALSEHEKALQSGLSRIAALGCDVQEVRERLLALAVEDKRLGETKADKEAMETFRAEQERVEKDLTQQVQSLRSDITELAEKFVRSGAGDGTADQQGAPSSEGANIFEQDISR
jgi:septal ring factor EnvC (AmiA/AmiB activator)